MTSNYLRYNGELYQRVNAESDPKKKLSPEEKVKRTILHDNGLITKNMDAIAVVVRELKNAGEALANSGNAQDFLKILFPGDSHTNNTAITAYNLGETVWELIQFGILLRELQEDPQD